MPEGIEIRKFADILRGNISNHTITKINILKGRYLKKVFDGFTDIEHVLPVKVNSINTKGKFTYIELQSLASGNIFWLFNTLGLTGGWTVYGKTKKDFNTNIHNAKYFKQSNTDTNTGIYTYPLIMEYITDSADSADSGGAEWFEKALNHLNIEFILDNGLKVYFYDQLSFGTLKIITNKIELETKLRELGPDIMNADTTFALFNKQITKKINNKKVIGNVIVNQKIISGIGNYLRADALWMTKISPFRKVDTITTNELELLYKNIRALMWGDYNYNEALQLGIITPDIKIPHDYKRTFFIYRQDKDIHGHSVSKKELFEGSQKRFIYWVESIQI